MKHTLQKYFHVWLMYAKMTALQQFSSKMTAIFFFVGKIFRFLISLMLIILLKNQTKSIAGYSLDEVMIFFLTFTLIDTFSQMLLRGVYAFSSAVRTGEFDFLLTKPMNSLFSSLSVHPDFNDVLVVIPFFIYTVWFISQSSLSITVFNVLLYFAFFFNSMLISIAFHILTLCLGILTLEVDNVIWMYRDVARMGSFPVAIFREPLRFIVTFIVPIGVMVSFPAEVLIGNIRPLLLIAFVVGILMFYFSIKTWNWSVKQYSSASS